MNTFFSYLFYWLGDAVCNLIDALSTDFRNPPEALMGALYKIYCKLMALSADLDASENIWLTRKDGETNEEFDLRCKEKFGDSF